MMNPVLYLLLCNSLLRMVNNGVAFKLFNRYKVKDK